jgi:mono/diheme cytochrome c family protein
MLEPCYRTQEENNVLKNLLAAGTSLLIVVLAPLASASDSAATSDKPPIEVANAAEKGSLRNPYTDADAEIVEQGKKLYFSKSCNGCHGGDDDTLFRLIALGTDEIVKQGYSRKRTENVKGPMIPFGKLIDTEDDMWKIITFIRSNYRGGESNKYGSQKAP